MGGRVGGRCACVRACVRAGACGRACACVRARARMSKYRIREQNWRCQLCDRKGSYIIHYILYIISYYIMAYRMREYHRRCQLCDPKRFFLDCCLLSHLIMIMIINKDNIYIYTYTYNNVHHVLSGLLFAQPPDNDDNNKHRK